MGGMLMSGVRVDRRVVEWELRERKRLERELAGYVKGLINSFNELMENLKPGLWVVKRELLRYVRDVGGNALLARETLKKLGMKYYDVEVAIRYLDEIVDRAKELVNMVNQLEHDGDYVRISPDFASLVERIGRYIDAVIDLLRELPFR
jgi:uncharacterized protein Yka (UPF0111/DUF47 family)